MSRQKKDREVKIPDKKVSEDKTPALLQELEFPPDLPPEERGKFAAAFFAGPVPPPSIMEEYERIVPGSAITMLSWADEEKKHRHSLQRKDLDAHVFQIRYGMIFGLIVAILGLSGSIALGFYDHDEVAKLLGGFTLFAMVTVFVTGKIIKD